MLYYSPDEVEAIATALEAGIRRSLPQERSLDEVATDKRDAEHVHVAAYTGLRLGKLLSLRWRDIEFVRDLITVSRAMSAGVEASTKSGRARRVPLPAPAAEALRRLRERSDFTAPSEFVFAGPATGRALNSVTVRRRYKQARDAIGARLSRPVEK